MDGTSYRWILGDLHGGHVSQRKIVIELANAPQSKLISKPAGIDWHFGDDYEYQVTPALIETGIRKALAEGWNPKSEGIFRLVNDSPFG